MISLDKFKILLGPLAEGLSDGEIERIRGVEYQLADAFFEQWLRKRNARTALSENPKT
ncbi:MAG: hypothetical protein Q7S47_02365 [bacterium]|nr:hypothetical protein [bacterium]